MSSAARPARIGLFSTLTGEGSRSLVQAVGSAVTSGDVRDTELAFLFVNRGQGESPVTDASVAALAGELGAPVIRESAVAFDSEARKDARAAERAGDDAPMWQWRERFYAGYRDRLPETDLDLLLGDMWIWSRSQCAERHGVNLHPALPGASIGKMWFEVIWDLVESGAVESGVMLHRVTPDVDLGPVVSYCRYSLRTAELEPLWAQLPPSPEGLEKLVREERALKRESRHPLFIALRSHGLKREIPLMLETLQAVGQGRIVFTNGEVEDAGGRTAPSGLDLTDEVEARLARS